MPGQASRLEKWKSEVKGARASMKGEVTSVGNVGSIPGRPLGDAVGHTARKLC